MSTIEVRRPFVLLNDTWYPFWDICAVTDVSDRFHGATLVQFASKGGKGFDVLAPLDEVLAAVADASGLAR